ncbi:MAG: hypothetical protein Kow0031_24270 [Anaerolineae bacterium]
MPNDDNKQRSYKTIALSMWTVLLALLLVLGLVQGQRFTAEAVGTALQQNTPPQNVSLTRERILLHLVGFAVVWGLGAAGINWLGNAIERNTRQARQYQQQLENALAEQQRLAVAFNQFFEQPLNIHLIAGLDSVIHEANIGWQTILGYNPAELKGARFLDLIHPDDRAATLAEMEKLGQGITIFYFENRYRHKNGEYRLLAWSAGVSTSEQRVYAVAADITDRKRAEEALQQSEKNYRTVLETAPIVAVIVRDNAILYINTAGVKVLGAQSADDLLGVSIMNFVTPTSTSLVRNRLDRLQQNHPNEAADVKIRRLDGTELFVQSTSVPITFNNRPAFLLMSIDITARKRAEAALQLSEELFSMAFQGGPLLMTISQVEDGTYLEVNENFLRITGYSREEAIGTTSVNLGLVTRADRDLLKQTLVESGRVNGIELALKKKSGDTFYCRYFGEMITVGGQHRLLSIAEDITERKRLQEEHVRQERLAAVGQLAAGIAHDFNNMLTPIIGFAELLELQQDIPDSTRPKLAWIIDQAQQAAKLVRQILDFSRQTMHEPRPLELMTFLDDAINFIRRTIPETIKVEFSHEPGKYIIHADPTQLQQVVTNLAVNARDAMPSGGQLTFHLARSPHLSPVVTGCDNATADSWIILTVSDTGNGIPAEALPRIFEPFFTTKEVGQGTGLGLAQVYGIVRQHQGCIDVSSRMGEGTTFTLYLPAAHAMEAIAGSGDTAIPVGRGETILLVEDEPVVLEVTRAMLETLNYRVLTAIDGTEALGVFRGQANNIALVLTDAVMPGLDGYGLARILHAEAPAIPVLMMTGYTREANAAPKSQGNIKARLHKPLKLNQLAQALDRELRTPPSPAPRA